jgi:hypothetical protein
MDNLVRAIVDQTGLCLADMSKEQLANPQNAVARFVRNWDSDGTAPEPSSSAGFPSLNSNGHHHYHPAIATAEQLASSSIPGFNPNRVEFDMTNNYAYPAMSAAQPPAMSTSIAGPATFASPAMQAFGFGHSGFGMEIATFGAQPAVPADGFYAEFPPAGQPVAVPGFYDYVGPDHNDENLPDNQDEGLANPNLNCAPPANMPVGAIDHGQAPGFQVAGFSLSDLMILPVSTRYRGLIGNKAEYQRLRAEQEALCNIEHPVDRSQDHDFPKTDAEDHPLIQRLFEAIRSEEQIVGKIDSLQVTRLRGARDVNIEILAWDILVSPN